jgi:hypothetical protein
MENELHDNSQTSDQRQACSIPHNTRVIFVAYVLAELGKQLR